MGVTALHLYEQLTEATDERTKAKIIAEAFGQLEERYPHLKDAATQGQLRETELRLLKEIESVRRDVEGVRLEIKGVEVKIAESRADLVRWVVSAGILQGALIIGVLLKVAHLI